MLKKLHIFLTLACAILAGTPSASMANDLEDPPAIVVGSEDLPSFKVTSLHQWIVDRMITWSPPGITYVKDAKETAEEGKKRYEEIANDFITVAYDPSEKPIFRGSVARAMTVALMASVAFHESAFRKDVDFGIGPLSKGDAGKSWCVAQIMMGRAERDGKTKTRVVLEGSALRFVNDPLKEIGWGGEDLVEDRQKCLRVALRLARMSFASCSSLPVQDRLAMYASGSCSAGLKASRGRVSTAQSWLQRSRPPLADEQAMHLLHSGPPGPPSKERAQVPSGIALLLPS